MQERVKEAPKRFLIRKGYEILDDDYDSLIVALDDDTVVFLDLIVGNRESGLKDTNMSRKEFESVVINWLATNDDQTDKAVRFDVLSFVIVSEDKAMLRHEIKRW